MNIVLTGFMGTGKSAVGKRLATALGLDFVDTDALIEEQEGRAISEVFDCEGEVYFRSVEEKVIKSVTSSMHDVVLSTGGGVVISSVNRELLARWGKVITLSASTGEIKRRLGQTGTRPLIDDTDIKGSLEKVLGERRGLYATAEFSVVTDGKGIGEVVAEILALVKT